MSMSMVNIRHVLMRVFDWVVVMSVGMRDCNVVRTPMMPVMMPVGVRMPMFMNDFFVPMDVFVLFGDEEYRSDDHDGQGRYE